LKKVLFIIFISLTAAGYYLYKTKYFDVKENSAVTAKKEDTRLPADNKFFSPGNFEGAVFIISSAKKNFYKNGMLLKEGDSLETGPAGLIDLAFSKNSRLRVGKNSLVKMQKLVKSETEEEFVLTLNSGSLLISFKESEMPVSLTVNMAAGSIYAKDAAFKAVVAKEFTKVINNIGYVVVKETEGLTKIPEGKAATLEKGKAAIIRNVNTAENIEMGEIAKIAGFGKKDGTQTGKRNKNISGGANSPTFKNSGRSGTSPDTRKSKTKAFGAWRTVLSGIKPFPKLDSKADPEKMNNASERNRGLQNEEGMRLVINQYVQHMEYKYLKNAIKSGDEFLGKYSKYAKTTTLTVLLFSLTENAISTENYIKASKYLTEIINISDKEKYKVVAAYGLACIAEAGDNKKSEAVRMYQKIAEENKYKYITVEANKRIEELR
jgi:hypothetical protein